MTRDRIRFITAFTTSFGPLIPRVSLGPRGVRARLAVVAPRYPRAPARWLGALFCVALRWHGGNDVVSAPLWRAGAAHRRRPKRWLSGGRVFLVAAQFDQYANGPVVGALSVAAALVLIVGRTAGSTYDRRRRGFAAAVALHTARAAS